MTATRRATQLFRRALAGAALCACALAGAAAAGTTGPTQAQLDALVRGDKDEPIVLARFLRGRARGDFDRYLRALRKDLEARGGERLYAGRIETVLTGGAPPYDLLLLEWYPTRRDCVESIRAVDPMIHSLGLADAFVLALRPWSTTQRLGARAAAAVFGTLFAREVPAQVAPVPPVAEAGDRAITPDPAAMRAFLADSADAPFAMLNLNQVRARAAYPAGTPDADVDGATAYRRYGQVALTNVMKRGGALLFYGTPVATVVGAPEHPLDQPWSEVALVFYPSRRAMQDMFADADYQASVPHRSAGLERAALLPTTPLVPAAED